MHSDLTEQQYNETSNEPRVSRVRGLTISLRLTMEAAKNIHIKLFAKKARATQTCYLRRRVLHTSTVHIYECSEYLNSVTVK